MTDQDLKIDLIKINFVIFGGVVSGMNIGLEYFDLHIRIGVLLVGLTALLQYLSLLPEFAALPRDNHARSVKNRMEMMNDWYILLGAVSYLFLIFGFVYPHMFSQSVVGAFLPFIFGLSIFSARLATLWFHPSKNPSKFDQLMLLLLMILVATTTLGVLETIDVQF